MDPALERKLDRIIRLLLVVILLLGGLLLAEVGVGNAAVLALLLGLFGVIITGLLSIFTDREWLREDSV